MARKLTDKQQRFVDEYLIDVERFDNYVDSSSGPDACWVWPKAKDAGGYGRFHIGVSRGSAMLAHRVAFGIATGETPEAVCHRCDNPSCCNPAHLFGGTRDDNNKDMTAKRRHWLHIDPSRATKGSQHGQAKLAESDIELIRSRYKAGGETQRGLAEEFGVCQRTIAKIVNREGWRHV